MTVPRPLALLFALACGALVSAPATGQSIRSPEALARALQQRYEGIHDFSASFTHTYRGGVLHTQATESGTVQIKKPNRMRWLYTTPEKKEFVSDGRKVYAYIPADRQVIVSNVPPQDEATTPALFLAGKGDIARDFTASDADATLPGTIALKLTPRRAEADYVSLVVDLDPATLQIRRLTTRDRQGGDSTLTFTNLKENRGLSDNAFVFRIPRGVDVVTDAPAH